MMLPHHISWQGRGFAVPLITSAWFFITVGSMIAAVSLHPDSPYIPDETEALAAAWRLVAGTLALSAASVLLFSHRCQKRHQSVPGLPPDEFMYLPLRFWPTILAACALGTWGWSYVGL
jgi:hypothetical protein